MNKLWVQLAIVLSTAIATMTYYFYTKPFVRVDVQEVYNLQAENATFILYTGRKNCPHCRAFVPTLYEASQNTIIYYLDSEDYKTNLDLQQFRAKYHIKTVPNLSKFMGNTLVDSLDIDDGIGPEDIIDFIK